jgi:hypothetical protein
MMRSEILKGAAGKLLYVAALSACLVGLPAGAALAASLDGAWATNASTCKQVFTKKGKDVVLAREADFYGSGFVIDGSTIRGKMATCKVTSRKEEGTTVRFSASCATDISISRNEFDLKILDDNKVMRSFPNFPEMDTPYYRCKL